MNIKNKLLVYGLSSALATSGVFIAKHEGLVLGTYPDPVGIVTSCYGHTGSELRLGQKFSEDECLEQLAKDLSKHNAEMSKYIKVPLSAEEHAAYLSFTYNVGVGNFKSSTLLKKLNSGDRNGACNELLRWRFAKGKELLGLKKRRIEEQELCLSGSGN
jgi:lysozyme